MNLGSLIKKCRKEKKLTLKIVAEKASVSEGFLSQVENSVSSPSVDTLVNICKAIGVNAGDLLNKANGREEIGLVHRSEWADIELPKTGFVTRRFLSPENRSVLDSALLLLAPEKSIPVRKNIKNGQEVLCVLKGSVELMHGDQTIEMTEGDAIHFYANPARQSIINRGKEIAVALWVGTL